MGLGFDFLLDVAEGFRPVTADRGGVDPVVKPPAPNPLTPPSSESAGVQPVDRPTDLLSSVGRVELPTFKPLSTMIAARQRALVGQQAGQGVVGSGVPYSTQGGSHRGPGYHVAKNPGLTGMIAAQAGQFMSSIGKPNETAGQWRDVGVRPPGGAARSYHYDGLALDIPLNANNQRESAIGDRLAAWVNANSGPGKPFLQSIWKKAHHFDHVHVTYNPDYLGPLPQIPRFA